MNRVELKPGVNAKAGEQFLRGDDLEPVWRDPLALAMFAAWVNVDPDKVPPTMRAYTCSHTKEAWERVAEAARKFIGGADAHYTSQNDEFATVEQWEHDDQRELSLLYNHRADDSLQFNRGQMREAIRHGKRLGRNA